MVSLQGRANSAMKRTTSKLLCTLDKDHKPVGGSVAAVVDAVRRGADLRRSSSFEEREAGLVEETGTLQTSWMIDDQHAGGLQTLRHPLDCGLGIRTQPSLSLWIFSAGARQRSAFVPIDGRPMDNASGQWVSVDNTPYGESADHLVPSRYRWWATDDWEEVCAHDEEGQASLADWEELKRAMDDGCRVKVGIRDLWSYLTPEGEDGPAHEVFMECTSEFSHLDQGFFGALTQPTFLLQPRVPLRFTGESFAYGWLVVRTDGQVQRQVLNPASMQWERKWSRHAVRWFVR